MAFFNWAAPIFGHYADRWTPDDVERIAGWLRPPSGPCDKLLDVGGGTGALATRLGQAMGAHATVLDPTPEMLRYAAESPQLRSVLGTAEAMPFDDDEFDALIVTDAFHHFRDQPGAVREFARVVRAGGHVLVLDLDPRGVAMGLIVWAEKLLGEPGAFFTPEQMCAFMARNGISGACTAESGRSYRFLGTIE